ncbi:hypothetical protein M0R45_005085 [Rubus argutus]|uniref:Uncharacterized protein n=1 Tax=Rubus argutus TaxID=59490 RepID=A0AAW1YLP1_RUBAR
MSVEAFAMAGMDYTKSGIDLEEGVWCFGTAAAVSSSRAKLKIWSSEQYRWYNRYYNGGRGEEMKARMRAWAKAVASMNDIVCISMKCSSTNVFR